MTNPSTLDGYTGPAFNVGRDRAEGAFLGASIGDALGWPHEMSASRAGKNRIPSVLGFERWVKRSGGRFQSYEEVIDIGHYSDDTQLILAVARSLVREPNSWWVPFATEELPLWTLYQRGGGGATKRAASSWLVGRAPWEAQSEDVAQYFSAGGNGVAMRILPHCLRHARFDDFAGLAADIMADGVTTHGHPRALVGALSYGFGLWQAFRHRGALSYGQLLDAVSTNAEVWGAFPDIKEYWPSWEETAQLDVYASLWAKTVQEQLDLLQRCSKGLAGGVAVIDEDVLRELGCFHRSTNGSGTVNAAAALFLASRNAADPIEGIKQAALAKGADTDTLASMTGGLLGAAIGLEWLSPFIQELQDYKTIKKVSNAILLLPVDGVYQKNRYTVTKYSLKSFIDTLSDLRETSMVKLPNGLIARAEVWNGVTTKAKSLVARSWRVALEDGQTLFFKKLTKAPVDATRATGSTQERDLYALMESSTPVHLGFRLIVSDLTRSAAFYQEVLGLTISKRASKSLGLGGILSITEESDFEVPSNHITVFAEVLDLKKSIFAYQRLFPDRRCYIEEREDRTRIRCFDPDGYQLEIYQMRR